MFVCLFIIIHHLPFHFLLATLSMAAHMVTKMRNLPQISNDWWQSPDSFHQFSCVYLNAQIFGGGPMHSPCPQELSNPLAFIRSLYFNANVGWLVHSLLAISLYDIPKLCRGTQLENSDALLDQLTVQANQLMEANRKALVEFHMLCHFI